MSKPLILSIGMPRAGSGWYYNLIHDLVVASGGQAAREIRRKFLLQPILTEINCNIGAFTTKRLLPVMIPAIFGNSFVIKAHAGPSPLTLRGIQAGRILPTYIYRDPRDALLSAFEYGQRKRSKNRVGAFSDLNSIELAIDFMREYIDISNTWLDCDLALHTRYENLLLNYDSEVTRILTHLRLENKSEILTTTLDQYRPEKGKSEQKGTHFVKGKIGRYKQVFTAAQQQLCLDAFGPYLEKMGYPIP
jgi:hypothetical protein